MALTLNTVASFYRSFRSGRGNLSGRAGSATYRGFAVTDDPPKRLCCLITGLTTSQLLQRRHCFHERHSILRTRWTILDGLAVKSLNGLWLTNRKDLRIERPLTFDSPSSTRLRMTITRSKQLHLSSRYLYRPRATIFSAASTENIHVNT